MKFNLILFIFMLGSLSYSCQEKEDIQPNFNLPHGKTTLKQSEVKYLDANLADACKKAFDGKCFHGETAVINPDSLATDADIENYCNQSLNHCPRAECEERIKVLLNFIPGATKGDPCLAYHMLEEGGKLPPGFIPSGLKSLFV